MEALDVCSWDFWSRGGGALGTRAPEFSRCVQLLVCTLGGETKQNIRLKGRGEETQKRVFTRPHRPMKTWGSNTREASVRTGLSLPPLPNRKYSKIYFGNVQLCHTWAFRDMFLNKI